MKILDISSFEKLKINSMSLNDFDKLDLHEENKYGITRKDMIGYFKGFPIGVIIRMLEEQENQGYESDIKKFIINPTSGFVWDKTEAGHNFWNHVITQQDFDEFFEKYPEYKKYN